MNEFFALLLLGIVQGLTEFLPVSSSGHLVLLSRIFGIQDSLLVSIILHVATLLSVVVALRKEVWQIVRHPFSPLSKKVVVSLIPTCLIVLILYPFITEAFEGMALPFCFLITAFLLLISDLFLKKSTFVPNGELSYKQALIIGIAQGFATFPGISRSGSTICAGVLAKGEREKVAKFSFLISIPVIILSMCLEIYKLIRLGTLPQINIAGIIIAFILAFLIGIFSIKFMIKLTQKLNFRWFSFYLIILAIITLFV